MSLFLHICTGLGLALAAGIRPFMPALLAGALAGSNVLFDFAGSHYAFLQSATFLLVVAALFLVCAVLRSGLVGELITTAGVILGGTLFAAILASHHDAAWPGAIAGVCAAAIASYATRPILAGARERLREDRAARFAVPFYADGAALVLAAACWFAGPLSLLAAPLLARLAWAQRARAAARGGGGLRVLR